MPEALAQDVEVQKSQYYRQLNFLARYKRALNKAMEKDPASVQLCHHLNTLMTEVENGKNKGEDISILLGILEATNDYLTGAIRLQEYEKKRIDVLGPKPSKCLRAIGAVMMAIGALLVVVGIAIAASGVGLFPGALVAAGGGTALYSGYTLFAKGNGSLGAAVDDVANHPFSKKGV